MKRAKIFPFRSKYARQLGGNRVGKKKQTLIKDVDHFKILPEGTLF